MDAEAVELFLNGRSLGRKPARENHDFTATYEPAYEPGELTAVSYNGGKETGRFSLLTAEEELHLCVKGAGRLEGLGSADPQSLGSYDDTEWETYDGYMMAVVRAGEEEGIIRIAVTAEGCEEQCVTRQVRKY